MNRIVLLGTGCPSPSHIRYGPSTLISTEKQKILIDAGSGVTQRLSEFGLAPSEIDVILITHLHSDHIVDLYQLYISGWHTGRTKPFKIVGPNNKLEGALKACKKYNPVLLDKTKKSNVIQITALRREIDKMSKDLKKFGLVSVSRTGAVAMTRGADIFK